MAGHLPAPPKGRTIVLGAGKASAAMAKAVEDHWPGPLTAWSSPATATRALRADRDRRGGASGARRGRARRRRAASSSSRRSAGADDLVLCLISGGGSALLALPAEGIDARRQAGGQHARCSGAAPTSAEMNMRAEASLGDQGRPAGGRRAPGPGGQPARSPTCPATIRR